MPSITIGSTLSGPYNEAFEIADFLGQGAFGEVYRAVGSDSGAVVAVKFLPSASSRLTTQESLY
jgi:serine/threonine protein kinase